MFSRLSVLLVALAVVVVPTVMRSRQHVELRDSTRLSIRLNWQSDAPPQKDFLVTDSQPAVADVPVVAAEQPLAAPAALRIRGGDEPPRLVPFDSAPELFRRPPPFSV